MIELVEEVLRRRLLRISCDTCEHWYTTSKTTPTECFTCDSCDTSEFLLSDAVIHEIARDILNIFKEKNCRSQADGVVCVMDPKFEEDLAKYFIEEGCCGTYSYARNVVRDVILIMRRGSNK